MAQTLKSLESILADPDAKIVFLPTQDIHYTDMRHIIDAPEDGSIPKIPTECCCDTLKSNSNSNSNPFEPFPFTSLYSFEQMGAMRKMRTLVNAVTITKKQIPFPKRKKKSWLRHTSNKKWNRKFTPQFIRVVNSPKKVLLLSPALFEKLKQLSRITKTTGPGAGAGYCVRSDAGLTA